jgi:hypothetical protein
MCPAEENSGEGANEAAEGSGRHAWASLLPAGRCPKRTWLELTDPKALPTRPTGAGNG